MILQIHHLNFTKNNQLLLNNINCEVKSGEMLHIQGENGSGKTTLLRILAGLIDLQEGKITLSGTDINEDKDAYKQHLQYLGHQHGIKSQLTVYENLKLMLTLLKGKKIVDNKFLFSNKIQSYSSNKITNNVLSNSFTENSINNILHVLKIHHIKDKYAKYLSAGQLRRTALAKLLLMPTQLWILDEPTTALDLEGQQLFQDLLSNHLNNGGMAILTTHQDFKSKLPVIKLQLSSFKVNEAIYG